LLCGCFGGSWLGQSHHYTNKTETFSEVNS
jgi:hypothetical protein